MDFRELKELREGMGLPRRAVAQLLGTTEQTIRRYESGELKNPETLAEFLKAYREIKAGTFKPSGKGVKLDDLVYIPLVAPRLAAGSGEVVQSEENTAFYAFRRDWLASKGNPKNFVLMRVTGSSMIPTILPEDMVMVDMSRNAIEEDRLFAIGWFDELAVKRLRRNSSGAVEVVADNPAYPSRTVEHNGDGLRIVGRVVWLGRDL